MRNSGSTSYSAIECQIFRNKKTSNISIILKSQWPGNEEKLTRVALAVRLINAKCLLIRKRKKLSLTLLLS